MARKLLYGHDSYVPHPSSSSSSSTPDDSLPFVSLHSGYGCRQNDDEVDACDAEDPLRHPLELKDTNTNTSNSGTDDTADTAFPQRTASTKTCDVSPPLSPSSRSRSWLWGRLVLVVLAVVYGSLNVSMRMVFARPDPPTPSISSTIQGWFAVLGFCPLLWWEQRRRRRRRRRGVVVAATHGSNGGGSLSSNGSSSSSSSDILPSRSKRIPSRSVALGWFALELALWNFGTQALINTSLLVTQGARASFLVATSVVWTPLLSSVVSSPHMHMHMHMHMQPTPSPNRRRTTAVVWMACALALMGTWILSMGDRSDADSDSDSGGKNANGDAASSSSSSSVSLSPAWGDACCLLAAICWSMYICRLSARGDSFDETTTQFVKNTILAILYTIWMLVSLVWHNREPITTTTTTTTTSESDSDGAALVLWRGWREDPIAWGILFYTALGPCTIADVCQQKAQALVPAAETNVLLSLEPVFAALLGFWILGECPSFHEAVGGSLIVAASFLAAGCGPNHAHT
eukprot:CAMPEP_0172362640 /NCGR_PEP_ID=MMETSP1060-20121228/6213_1 /TAXON_ID=37318 /ORGANISM="Pseudo-nitzschia pungens, Strain cf. cingulata" /LENGTH=516 /DNA_ID=CAMNT_0013085195 /DNA_START=876 /DNA_END=2429 /DNA_ORIENTATION=+